MKKLNLLVLLSLSATSLHANDLFVGEDGRSRIGEYTTTGAVVNASLIPNIVNPRDISVDSSGNLLVAAAGSSVPSTLGLYTTSGKALNPTLASMTGVDFFWGAVLVNTNLVATVVNSASIPSYTLVGTNTLTTNNQYIGAFTKYSAAIVSDGTYFYVNDSAFGYLQKYTLKGALVTASLAPQPADDPSYMALDGTNLYVIYRNENLVAKFSTSGAVISTNLIPGISSPSAIAADGAGHIFVTSYGGGTIGEYSTNGSVINASLVTGLSNPFALAVDPRPILNISKTNNTVYVSWITATNFFLQTNSTTTSTNWGTDTNVGATNGLSTATTPASNLLFFRLKSTNF